MPLSIRKHPAASWKLPFSAAELARLLQAMLDEAGHSDAVVELALLDDKDMEDLTRQSAGLPGPTNILSFPVSDDGPCLGWLALSADTLQRESFLYGQDEREHCLRLLAHGLAHLTGLDHGPAMDSLAHRLESAARDTLAHH